MRGCACDPEIGAVIDPFRPNRSTRPARASATRAFRTLPVSPSLATTPFIPTGSIVFRERVRTASGRANWNRQRTAQQFDGDRAAREPVGSANNVIGRFARQVAETVSVRPGAMPARG